MMKVPDIKGLVSIARGMIDTHGEKQIKLKPGAADLKDKVELSSQGQEVMKLTQASTGRVDRAGEVALLKADFERGELKAEPAKIAQAMVDNGIFDDIIEGHKGS